MTDFYSTVPKETTANVAYRLEQANLAANSEHYATMLTTMCSRDILFYINSFVWTYDPRKTDANESTVLPFITYEYQDRCIQELVNSIGKNDVLIEKSRDMGASWMCLATLEWMWHFRDMMSFLLVSRKEEYVDKRGDPKSLFWKIDFIHQRLPDFLKPKVKRQSLHLTNADNGSTFDGESTTGDVGAGDRRTAILLDEFARVKDGYRALASTADVTRSRIFNSTPQGTANAFYDVKQEGRAHVIRLHWTEHPDKSRGLYRSKATGGLVPIDEEFWNGNSRLRKTYPFIIDGRLRSPWYDQQCTRRSNQEIAQELDIDYIGSGFSFFPGDLLEEHQSRYCCPPFHIGELDFDRDTKQPTGFTEEKKGNLRLWIHPNAQGKICDDRLFVLGADISAGTGASNSVASVLDCRTGEKVAEYVTSIVPPHELAHYLVALARWFKGYESGALMLWEAQGPGFTFGRAVIDAAYGRIYYRRQENLFGRKQTNHPGWHKSRETGRELLESYRLAIKRGDFINRSHEAINECRYYVFQPDGTIEHDRARNYQDPSGARTNHGDRVIADGLAWMGYNELGSKRSVDEERDEATEAPYGSFGWRRKEHVKATSTNGYGRW